MKKIYIIDLKNCQKDYTAALDFIRVIEDKLSG